VIGSVGIWPHGGAAGKAWYGEGRSSLRMELMKGTVRVRRGSIVEDKMSTDLSPGSQIARSPVEE
jgi:hypothetical protein